MTQCLTGTETENKTESIEGKRKNDSVTEREKHRSDRTRHRGRKAGKLRSFSFSHELRNRDSGDIQIELAYQIT